MNQRVRILDLLAITLGSALTRLLLYAGHTGLHSFDAGNLLLGAIRYDIAADQPHLPGYPLFTWLASVMPWQPLLNAQILIVVAAALAAACTYGALATLYDRRTAVATTVLLMLLPYVWYYTSVVETYVFDLLFASAIVWASAHARTRITLPTLLALAGGFRPTSMIFLAPLTAVLLWRHRSSMRGSQHIASIMLGVITLALWLVPMLQATGGLSAYMALYSTNSPLPERSFVQNMEGLVLHLPYFLVPAVLVRVLSIRSAPPTKSFDALLILAWLMPAGTAVVFLHYAKGYLLLIAVPLMLVVVQPWKRSPSWSAWAAGIAIAIAMFWFIPARPADPTSVMRHDQRTMTAWQISLDRFFSVYSLTSDAYQHQESLIAIERVAANAARNNSAAFILVDPTCVVRPRAMQILEPRQRFASLRTDTTAAVWSYQGMDRMTSAPSAQAFDTGLLTTQERFARDVLGTNVQVLEQRGPWVACAIRQPAGVQRIYDSLFVRVR
jgi:hypothetical protein